MTAILLYFEHLRIRNQQLTRTCWSEMLLFSIGKLSTKPKFFFLNKSRYIYWDIKKTLKFQWAHCSFLHSLKANINNLYIYKFIWNQLQVFQFFQLKISVRDNVCNKFRENRTKIGTDILKTVNTHFSGEKICTNNFQNQVLYQIINAHFMSQWRRLILWKQSRINIKEAMLER